jgi:hypothetical protein
MKGKRHSVRKALAPRKKVRNTTTSQNESDKESLRCRDLKRIVGRCRDVDGSENCPAVLISTLGDMAYDQRRSGTPEMLEAVVTHAKEKQFYCKDVLFSLSWKKVSPTDVLVMYARAAQMFALAGVVDEENAIYPNLQFCVNYLIERKTKLGITSEAVEIAIRSCGVAGLMMPETAKGHMTKTRWLHDETLGSLAHLWKHSSKQKKVRVSIGGRKNTKEERGLGSGLGLPQP